MKTWVWVLLLAVAVLFWWTTQREGFQSTPTLHGPPYGGCTDFKPDGTCRIASDYHTIVSMMPPALVTALETKRLSGPKPMPKTNPTPTDTATYLTALNAYQKKLVDGIISDLLGEFYSKVYQPASTPLTAADVDTFLVTYLAQIYTTSPTTNTFLSTNQVAVKAFLVAYFVTQTRGALNGPLLGSGATAEQQAAATAAASASTGYSAATGYAATLADVGQGSGGDTAATGDTGNTTGGSSTTPGANSGTNKGNLFGPAFTGFGDNSGAGANGPGSRDYPTLIGPIAKLSKYVEGAGIMNLSQSDTLATSGVLPSGAGTGSDPNSRFFGSSRTPGDRDLIPDANQIFTPSIGSSKTEPVPYLSDFSAFAK